MIRYACVDGEIRAITYVICPSYGSGDSHGCAGGRRSSCTMWSGVVDAHCSSVQPVEVVVQR